MLWNRRAATLMLSALATACGSDGSTDGVAAPASRDSAGVRIVENGQAPASGWRVAPTPLFTLGWGPDEPTFTWIQAGRILDDGGAVVGDGRAGTIYRIGADGSVLATWGRQGEGPGEYRAFDAMLMRGDSILISDGRLRRLTLLSQAGDVLATRPLPGAFLHQVSSILDDGRLLLIPGDSYGAISQTRPEWVFETQPILAATPETGTVDTLAELPHLRRWYGSLAAGPGPLMVKGRAAGFEDGFAWSRADEPAVYWYDATGRLTQIARWEEEPVPITAELRSRMASRVEERLRAGGAEEPRVRAGLIVLEEGLDRHEGPLPYWDAFYVDRQGNAWLREYASPGEPSTRWRVVARDGRYLGWIDAPDVASILDITDDRILAVRQDELDVPAVVMLALSKD
jgi:hypothetical protein